MGRNKLIYALATRTLVVASDLDSGGTWAGATECLKRGFGEVAVWRGEGEGPGNEALVSQGAREVRATTDLFGESPAPAPAPAPAEALKLPL
jgi:predicted Rossmann fold nucleotide-binding protein DprA/Smf involved in DNA uptake